jgi:hypothetical protein
MTTQYNVVMLFVAVPLAFSAARVRAEDHPPPPPSALSTAEQVIIDQCRDQYGALRQEVETKAEPIRDADHSRISAPALCKLLISYAEVEYKMISFIFANSNKCGIPREISEKIRVTYAATEKMKAEACSKARY